MPGQRCRTTAAEKANAEIIACRTRTRTGSHGCWCCCRSCCGSCWLCFKRDSCSSFAWLHSYMSTCMYVHIYIYALLPLTDCVGAQGCACVCVCVCARSRCCIKHFKLSVKIKRCIAKLTNVSSAQKGNKMHSFAILLVEPDG